MKKYLFVIAILLAVYTNNASAEMHTFNGDDSIHNIEVQVVYYLPKDGTPLPDWQERFAYYMQRAEKFHQREFHGQSNIKLYIVEEPFYSQKTQAEMPGDDPNSFFWSIITEVDSSQQIKYAGDGFPILLVLSDNNFSPSYDDWTRECDGKGCVYDPPHEQCRGYVRHDGDHRPGSRCGGARAVYWAQKHHGYGLVTADGWRVPIKGSDCVFYHEGIGHTVGLPHPEPIDDSVMGTAQYVDAIHATWVTDSQKTEMGFEEVAINKDDLFSTFTIGHEPLAPKANEEITFFAKLPSRFDVQTITLEYQTGLRKAFQPIETKQKIVKDNRQIYHWKFPGLDSGMSLAYRIRVVLEDGEKEMIWHYVKAK